MTHQPPPKAPPPSRLHPFHFTDAQRKERAQQEAAMRAGQLRRLPTVFGGL